MKHGTEQIPNKTDQKAEHPGFKVKQQGIQYQDWKKTAEIKTYTVGWHCKKNRVHTVQVLSCILIIRVLYAPCKLNCMSIIKTGISLLECMLMC